MSCLHIVVLATVLVSQGMASTISDRACQAPFDKFPFCDTTLSIDARVDDLVSRIHNEEKGPLMTARGDPRGNLFNLTRIGVPALDFGTNCIHSAQTTCVTSGGKTYCPTTFPAPNTLGSSFNFSLVRAMGNVIGRELRAMWLAGATEPSAWSGYPHAGLDCWSPNINIARDPRWGRNEEVPSEDPLLAGDYGKMYTLGLQNSDLDSRYVQVVVTLKHFAAYSLEDSDGYTRHTFNAQVSDYDLATTYFPAWKASVMEGGAKGVMCSYNELNGIPTCASAFLNDTLRGKWGFQDGYVTSDTDAVADIYQTHKYVKTAEEATGLALTDGGCDMDSGGTYWHHVDNAVAQGHLTWSAVDRSLKRLMKLRFLLGLFDPIEDQPLWKVPLTIVQNDEAVALNRLATQQSMVLLKNERNTLPFRKGLHVAVVGPHGNGSSVLIGNYRGQVCPTNYDDLSCVQSVFQGIAAANEGGKTEYAEGCTVTGTDKSRFAAALDVARAADVVVLALGLSSAVEGESHDRVSIDLPGVQSDFAKEVLALGKPTTVLLINGGTVALEPEVIANASAILEAFYPGFEGAFAIGAVLFGDYNPAGRLAVTMYAAGFIDEIKMSNMNMSTAPGRGYRYYTGSPLFPFGWGLSYTSFSLVWHEHAPAALSHAHDSLQLYCDVTNTGARDGDEVLLVYFSPSSALGRLHDPRAVPLKKQLIAYQRVHVAAGATTTVTFKITPEMLALSDAAGVRAVYPGDYGLEVTNGVHERLFSSLAYTGDKFVMDRVRD